MIKSIYRWFHRLSSNPQERDEYSGGYWQDKIRRQALALCRDGSGRVLEVGCGEGLFLARLAGLGGVSEIHGVDINDPLLHKAGRRMEEKGIKNVKLSLQDASRLSFDDGYFDIVVCVNVFFNMDSIDTVRQALIQIKRVCKPRGRIIFDFRNSLNPLLKLKYALARYYDDTVKDLPLSCYAPEEIEALLKSLGLFVSRRVFISPFIFKRYAPIVLIEAENR